MKSTLAYDKNARQFRCDVGTPPKRFYLGGEAGIAQQRKEALIGYWNRIKLAAWTDETLSEAKQIAKGGTIILQHSPGGDEATYLAHEAAVIKRVGKSTTIRPAITAADLATATESLLLERIAQLEAMVKQHVGAGAADQNTITVHAALDAYHTYRMETEINPDTRKPTDHVGNEGDTIELIKRHIDATLLLTALSYAELHRWCKKIAARPLSKKFNQPIALTTVRNCLKTIRPFCKWAGRHYGWKRPDDWHEATLVMVRRTADERRKALANIENYFQPADIGTLWKYALPVERMLILLGLNFGFAQAEILNMRPSDIVGEYTTALRGKSSAVGRWKVWAETTELAKTQFAKIPRTRQNISNVWNRLIDRIQKDMPEWRKEMPCSFKWLRKSGSSIMRRIAGAEVASLYLSHGESAASDDKLLDVYAAADWTKVCTALDAMRDELLPHLQGKAEQRTYIAISAIDRIRQLWSEGLKPAEIAKQTHASRATVYRYRPTGIAAAE